MCKINTIFALEMIKVSNIFSLNWCATIGINYTIGGLTMVLRMPVKVYGKLKWNISGKIILPENIIRNTLIIGSKHEDYTTSAGRAELNIKGIWKINGVVRLGHDCFIGVKESGTLEMGDGCMIGRDTQIHCSDKIVLGNDVFAGEMYVTDCSEHHIFVNNEEKSFSEEVCIGTGSYIGFRCMLLKGCRIPPQSVVASGSVCTKDYSTAGTEKLFIAGIPAIVKEKNVTAIK